MAINQRGLQVDGCSNFKRTSKKLCVVTGDAYMQVQSDVCTREDVDTTLLCEYKLPDGTFGLYEDLEKALNN